jgi:uncharacterized membrane protein YdjX (TVP38/TMEM64 family)
MHDLDHLGPTASDHLKSGRLLGILGVLVVLAVGLLALWLPFKEWLPSGATLKTQLDAFGLGAPLVFVVGTALLMACGAPRLVLGSIAGMIFGAAWGLVWSLAGTLLGAYGTFLAVRAFGRDPIRRRYPQLDRYSGRLHKQGFLAVLLIRQLPMNGFYNNLLLGLSPVRHRDFLLGSVLGYLPVGMAAVSIGAGAVQADLARLVQFAVAGGAAFLLLGLLVKRLTLSVGATTGELE